MPIPTKEQVDAVDTFIDAWQRLIDTNSIQFIDYIDEHTTSDELCEYLHRALNPIMGCDNYPLNKIDFKDLMAGLKPLLGIDYSQTNAEYLKEFSK